MAHNLSTHEEVMRLVFRLLTCKICTSIVYCILIDSSEIEDKN
jgi:hypothetical protein